MYRINDEINKREQSKFWSEEIANKVLSEKVRRTKRKLAVTGSSLVVFFLFFVIGFDFSKTEPVSPSWSDTFISAVADSIYPYVIPQDVEEFITYSFNGQ